MPKLEKMGFSLLEVMMSLVVLSFLMLGTYAMVNNSQDAKQSVTVEDNAVLQVQLALNRLESDFSQIYSPIYFSSRNKNNSSAEVYSPNEQFPGVTGEGHPIPLLEHSDKETLMFMTSSNRRKMEDVKQSRWAWVQYTLEEVDSVFTWVRRSTAEDPFAPNLDWGELRPQILVKNVKDIIFKFWDVEKKDWIEGWDDDTGKKLYAVRVELNWIDANEIEQTNIRVFRVLWPYPNFFFNLIKSIK